MNTLFQAMNTGTGCTRNGAVTNTTSFNKCLDLFNMIGSSRGKDLYFQFDEALNENEDVALRVLQWARDCRGGAGEREVFRKILRKLVHVNGQRENALKILAKVPELGYWKDLINLYDVKEFQKPIQEMVIFALLSEDKMCAKYMPRKGRVAVSLAKALGLTNKQWRQLIVQITGSTVETHMCAKKWDEIDFSKIPSLAGARLQKAFMRNAETKYNEYIANLEKGEAKINAGTLFPYDVLKSVQNGVTKVADQQWKALPNYMEGTDERILPLIDVSYSMNKPTGITGMDAMHVAVSLGMYLSERAPGVFKDHFMTFDTRPKMMHVTGSLSQRYAATLKTPWGGDTNIQNAFETLLESAKRHKVPAEEMPTMIVILSDMEFNCSWVAGRSASAFEMIEHTYEEAGYGRPKLVFWNLDGRVGNSPVTIGTGGTCMVSGASPSILTSVLGAKDFNPNAIMLDAVMKDRYTL